MALAQYSDTFWFPTGVLATAVPARVFPLNSNTLATLYTDATGTTTLPNPVTTDAFGVLEFWAEEGEYWIHIDTESFRVSVGSPSLDVMEVAASSISTGVVAGGVLTVNAGNPAAIDITEMVGYVVDSTTDPLNPAVTRVHLPAQTVALDAGGLSRFVTWWMVTPAGGIVQQEARPTGVQQRTHIVLGVTAQQGGAIIAVDSLPVLLREPMSQLADLMDALGPFVLSGAQMTPNANLTFNLASGLLFARAFNHVAPGGGPENPDPHRAPTVAQTPAEWFYVTRNATLTPSTTLIDPTQYDNGGVLTPVGGGSNTSTIQRVWLYPTGEASSQLGVQYGQSTHSSLSAAVAAIGMGNFVPFPQAVGAAALLGYIAVIRTATNLADPAQATFVRASRFATP